MKKIIGVAVLAALLCYGCSVEKENDTKVKDLDFTVIREEEIPEELKKVIESKKQQIFKLTYKDDGAMYIAVGYGQQQSGGYSIQIEELYLSENAVYFNTELQGPKKEEIRRETQSYPYIVVKTELREESVVFQ